MSASTQATAGAEAARAGASAINQYLAAGLVDGHDATAVDLPWEDESAGCWDYADAVVGAIGDGSEVVVVVGHSWCGSRVAAGQDGAGADPSSSGIAGVGSWAGGRWGGRGAKRQSAWAPSRGPAWRRRSGRS